jgi:uncharacterized protein (UPF0261 family)
MYVYLLATLDTKGSEAKFIRDLLRQWGVAVRVVDVSGDGAPLFQPEIDRRQVTAAAGVTLEDIANRGDRGYAVTCAARGAAALARRAYEQGELAGVIALGGSAGTTIGTAAMRALPLGTPKVMLSTLASGQVRPFIGDKDIAMFNSVVDLAGLNRISRQVLHQAAAALAGMVTRPFHPVDEDRPLVAATMFGVTTPCVMRAREVLEEAGFEVLVFHATGNGGQAMEGLIRDGQLAGVLDITTTELADELVGGVLSAGPDRLTAAAACGVPQVVSVGALDMVNFGPRATVPRAFAARKFHVHNANVTLMRTTAEENARLGEEICHKLSASRGPTAIVLPLAGLSAIDRAEAPFDDPAAREALYNAIREHHGEVPLFELPVHINDPVFSEFAANKLLELLKESRTTNR